MPCRSFALFSSYLMRQVRRGGGGGGGSLVQTCRLGDVLGVVGSGKSGFVRVEEALSMSPSVTFELLSHLSSLFIGSLVLS